jgi:hypothetical protein
MPFPDNFPLDQILLELCSDKLGSADAHADEPDATISETLDRRHSDLGFLTSRAHFAFAERQQDCSAHAFAPRFAAASASRAFE